MTEISERYRRLSDSMTARIRAVGDDAWSSPTPCEGWTVRDLVRHLVETQDVFARMVGLEPTPGPSVQDDPVGAWTTARDQVLAWLEDPDAAGREYEGQAGRSTFEQSVDGFLGLDLVVHGWDLARATGQDERIDPQEVERVQRMVDGLGEMIRSEGVCGPAVDIGPEADPQARLLAHLGRRP